MTTTPTTSDRRLTAASAASIWSSSEPWFRSRTRVIDRRRVRVQTRRQLGFAEPARRASRGRASPSRPSALRGTRMTLRGCWLVAERPSERARQTRSPPRMSLTACANGAARTAPKVVSSGKSGDVTSTVPSSSSIRFTGYVKISGGPCRRDDHARIRAGGGNPSGRAAWRLTFAGGRPTRANAYEETSTTSTLSATAIQSRLVPLGIGSACRLQPRAGEVAERLADHAVDRVQVEVAVVLRIAELSPPVPADGVDPGRRPRGWGTRRPRPAAAGCWG